MLTFIFEIFKKRPALQPLDMINDSQQMAGHMFGQHHLRGQRLTQSWMT